jgi:hypothetical protein
VIEWFLKDFLTALLVGVLASVAFLALLSRMRPRIDVSPWIAKAAPRVDKGINVFPYRIKIRNRTRASVVDIRAQLQLITRMDGSGGVLFRRVALPRHKRNVDHAIFSIGRYDKNDPEQSFLYRYTFEFEKPLEEILEGSPNSFLRFRLFGRHSVSGFGELVEKRFRVVSLVAGEFVLGDSLEVSKKELFQDDEDAEANEVESG